MKEQALAFGPGRGLLGVLTDPDHERRREDAPAFVLLNSGVLHRVGPNRLSVRIARDLAARGHVSLRFDFSGVGESPPSSSPEPPPGRFVSEVRQAMDFLAAARNVRRFRLFGNCSGAGISFLTAVDDDRVEGAALVNPQGRRTMRYMLRLSRNPTSWIRLWRGMLRTETLREDAPEGRAADAQAETAAAEGLERLIARGCDLLFAFCEWDPGLDSIRSTRPALVRERTRAGRFHVIPGANHDFDLVASQDALARIVCDWTAEREREGD